MSLLSKIKDKFNHRDKKTRKKEEVAAREELIDPSPQILHMMSPVINNTPIIYKKHMVCFLDVFNYESSLVANNYLDSVEVLVKEIRSLIRNISKGTRSLQVMRPDGTIEIITIDLNTHITSMFNGVVISYDLSNRREDLADINAVFIELSIVSAELARMGYFAYGGLAYGDLNQTDYTCSGEAIERALSFSCNTGYPRIVIDSHLFMEDSNDSLINGIDYNMRNLNTIEELFHCVDLTGIPQESWNINHRRNPELTHYLDYMEFTFSHDPELIKTMKKHIEKGISKSSGDEKKIFIRYAECFNSIVHNVLMYDISECVNISE